jgi:hypothetical protein
MTYTTLYLPSINILNPSYRPFSKGRLGGEIFLNVESLIFNY